MKCSIRWMTTHRWSMSIVHGCRRRSSLCLIETVLQNNPSCIHRAMDVPGLKSNETGYPSSSVFLSLSLSLSLSPLSQMMRVMPRSRSEQFNVEVEKEMNLLLDVFDNLDMLLVGCWLDSDDSVRANLNTYRRRAYDRLTDWLTDWHGGHTPII